MKKEEIKELSRLLDKYFEHEFKVYSQFYNVIYGENVHIESIEPESLFIDYINKDTSFQNLLEDMKEKIMYHIVYVFILKKDGFKKWEK